MKPFNTSSSDNRLIKNKGRIIAWVANELSYSQFRTSPKALKNKPWRSMNPISRTRMNPSTSIINPRM